MASKEKPVDPNQWREPRDPDTESDDPIKQEALDTILHGKEGDDSGTRTSLGSGDQKGAVGGAGGLTKGQEGQIGATGGQTKPAKVPGLTSSDEFHELDPPTSQDQNPNPPVSVVTDPLVSVGHAGLQTSAGMPTFANLGAPAAADFSKMTAGFGTGTTGTRPKLSANMDQIRTAAKKAEQKAAERAQKGGSAFGWGGHPPPSLGTIYSSPSNLAPGITTNAWPQAAGFAGNWNPVQGGMLAEGIPAAGAPFVGLAGGFPGELGPGFVGGAGGGFGTIGGQFGGGTWGGSGQAFAGSQWSASGQSSSNPPAATSSPMHAPREGQINYDPEQQRARFDNMSPQERDAWLKESHKVQTAADKWADRLKNQIGVCSGAVTSEVRDYIARLREVRKMIPTDHRPWESLYIGSLLSYTATDSMARTQSRLIQALCSFDPRAFSVTALLNVMAMEYLGIAEVQALRSDLEKLAQGGDKVADYNRKFAEHQAMAYSNPTPSEKQEITQLYIHGLTSQRARDEIFKFGIRNDLTAAMNVATYMDGESTYKKYLEEKYSHGRSQKNGKKRKEEPMDVSSTDVSVLETKPIRERLAEHDKQFKAILVQLERITGTGGKSQSNENKSGQGKQGEGKKSGPPQKKPRQNAPKTGHCFVCGKLGHFAAKCDQRAPAQGATPTQTAESPKSGN